MVALGSSGVWLELAGVGGGESTLVFGLLSSLPSTALCFPRAWGAGPCSLGGLLFLPPSLLWG